MEERRRHEMQYMKDRNNFIQDYYKPHNFASSGQVDMYGASANHGGSYNQSGAPRGGSHAMNTSSSQLLFTTPSAARPAVVSEGGCCCSIM